MFIPPPPKVDLIKKLKARDWENKKKELRQLLKEIKEEDQEKQASAALEAK